VERGYLAEVWESDHYVELMGLDTFTGAETNGRFRGTPAELRMTGVGADPT
jgi:hypothetical protein